MASVVIFDIGNVLISFDKMIACEGLARYSNRPVDEIYRIIVASKLEDALGMGEISGHAFASNTIDLIGAKDLSHEKFMEIWQSVFTENREILPLLNELHARKIPVAIISSNDVIAYAACREFETVRLFEDWGAPIILSHEVGHLKPHKKIYATALDALKCQASDAVFIDDIPENVEGAESVGMAGIEYKCTVHSIDYLREKLRNVGIDV